VYALSARNLTVISCAQVVITAINRIVRAKPGSLSTEVGGAGILVVAIFRRIRALPVQTYVVCTEDVVHAVLRSKHANAAHAGVGGT
jgi:hypothetical protein